MLSCVTVPSGLGFWAPLDTSTTSGSTTNDLSGNGNNGTLQNSPSLTTGKIQQGVSLNGSTQYVSLPDAALPATPTAFSITAWFKTSVGLGPAGALLNRLNSAGTQGYQSFVYNGLFLCQVNSSLAVDGSTIADNAFHFGVCTWDGTDIIRYVDGSTNGVGQAVSGPIISAGTGTGNIGNDLQHTQTWSGVLDDARFYSRAINSTEVTSIYNSGLAGKP